MELPTYKTYQNGWEEASKAGFYTKTQLDKMGKALRRNQPVRAEIKNHYGEYYNLYRSEEARDKRKPTKKQLEVLARGRKRETCSGCAEDFHPSKLRPFSHFEELKKRSLPRNVFCSKCLRLLQEEWEQVLWRREQRNLALRRSKDLLTSQNTVYLDTETTGLDHDSRIVDIAILDVAGRILMNTLVNPGVPIPAEATAVHGITDAMVQDASAFDALLPDIERILKDKEIVIYNVSYDRPILQSNGLDTSRYQYACAKEMYAAFYGEWSDYHKSFRWQSLGDALEQCGLDFPGQAHKALGDCQATRLLIEYMANSIRCRILEHEKP